MQDILMRYNHFHPSAFTQTYLDAKMQELQAEAPYDSVLKADFFRKEKMFRGVVRITSSAGHFFATASGTHVSEVGKKLFDQIRKQLNKWKSLRFQGEKLGMVLGRAEAEYEEQEMAKNSV